LKISIFNPGICTALRRKVPSDTSAAEAAKGEEA